MKTKFYLLSALILLLNPLLESSVLAQEIKPKVKLISGENYYPFSSRAAPNNGWFVAVVTRVFEQLELEVEVD